MHFIGFGVLSYTILYPLLFPLSLLARGVLRTQITDYKYQFVMNSLLMYISEILLGLINICYKCFNYSSEESKKAKSNRKSTIDSFSFLDKSKEIKKLELSFGKKILFCGILSIFDFLSFSLPMIKTSEDLFFTQLSNEMIFIKILIISILCKFVLSYKLQRQQIVSIVVIILGTVINISFLFFLKRDYIKTMQTSIISAFFIFFLSSFIQSVQIVGEKYFFVKYRQTLYDIFLFEGIFGVFFIMCFAGLLYLYPCPNFMKDCNNEEKTHFNWFLEFSQQFQNKNFYFYIPLYIIASAGINYLSRQSTYYYSPTTHTISDSLGGFFFIFILEFSSLL